MKDPNRGKYKKLYSDDFKRAEDYLLPLYNGALTWSNADYQAFQYQTEGVKIIFYPHKTSSGNYHIRVRDGGSKDKIRAQAIMDVMQFDNVSNHTCTFSQKKRWPQFHFTEKVKQQIREIAKGREYNEKM